jgi:sterol desaturase/sphingolipid hydroxylase (fatty acid hydroxylase superfamily)
MIAYLVDCFAAVQAWLFEVLLQPLIYRFGLVAYLDDAFEGVEWLLVGLCELVLLFLVLRPLEALIPAQPITDRGARWNDFFYTVLHRLGLFPVLMFFTVDQLTDHLAGLLRLSEFHTLNLETLWPGITPVASFLVYFVVLDFCDYWFHRGSHKFRWWWGLHSLHHSQQNMNLWSDDRNHLLDDVLHTIYMSLIALGIGVEPAQYVLLVSLSRIAQSLQHANVRLHFGRLGERLLVSPRFHRLHHAIGFGHERRDGPQHAKASLGGCNFGVVLPWWDIVFRTANFSAAPVQVGIRDQLPRTGADGVVLPARDYGRGFWRQQWLGLKRMASALRGSAG